MVLVLAGCSKDDDPAAPDSLTGYWTVSSPDNVTTITFKIGINADREYVVEAAAVQHDGAEYRDEPIDAQVIVSSPTAIESITFRTTDFVIRLLDISVSSDFMEFTAANAIFTFGTSIREFSGVKGTR